MNQLETVGLSLNERLNLISMIYGNVFPLNNGICIVDNQPENFDIYQNDLKIVNSFTAKLIGTVSTYKTHEGYIKYNGIINMDGLVLIRLSIDDGTNINTTNKNNQKMQCIYNEMGDLIYKFPFQLGITRWHCISGNRLLLNFFDAYIIIYNTITHKIEEHFEQVVKFYIEGTYYTVQALIDNNTLITRKYLKS